MCKQHGKSGGKEVTQKVVSVGIGNDLPMDLRRWQVGTTRTYGCKEEWMDGEWMRSEGRPGWRRMAWTKADDNKAFALTDQRLHKVQYRAMFWRRKDGHLQLLIDLLPEDLTTFRALGVKIGLGTSLLNTTLENEQNT